MITLNLAITENNLFNVDRKAFSSYDIISLSNWFQGWKMKVRQMRECKVEEMEYQCVKYCLQWYNICTVVYTIRWKWCDDKTHLSTKNVWVDSKHFRVQNVKVLKWSHCGKYSGRYSQLMYWRLVLWPRSNLSGHVGCSCKFYPKINTFGSMSPPHLLCSFGPLVQVFNTVDWITLLS